MAICRAQVVIPHDSALPADAVTNTWAFELDDPSTAGITNVDAALATFYNGWSSYRSVDYNWSATRVKWFNMEDPEPRVPFADLTFGVNTTAAGTAMPSEVALCLSFRGATGSGFDMAKRRGRVYLGPLNINAVGTGGRPLNTFMSAVSTSADTFIGLSGASDWLWGVISLAGIGVGFTPVVAGWVDDAFDIQRRRGILPSSRLTFT